MFDTWDGSYWEPNNAYSSGSGIDWNQIINRTIDVIGGRTSPNYVSPDDPRYRQQQWPIGSGGGGYYPYPDGAIGGGGTLQLTPMTYLIIGGIVLFILMNNRGRR